jgi:hypothetical protein
VHTIVKKPYRAKLAECRIARYDSRVRPTACSHFRSAGPTAQSLGHLARFASVISHWERGPHPPTRGLRRDKSIRDETKSSLSRFPQARDLDPCLPYPSPDSRSRGIPILVSSDHRVVRRSTRWTTRIGIPRLRESRQRWEKTKIETRIGTRILKPEAPGNEWRLRARRQFYPNNGSSSAGWSMMASAPVARSSSRSRNPHVQPTANNPAAAAVCISVFVSPT